MKFVISALAALFLVPAVGSPQRQICPEWKIVETQISVTLILINLESGTWSEQVVCQPKFATKVYDARENENCGGAGDKEPEAKCAFNIDGVPFDLELRTYLQLSKLKRFFESESIWKLGEVYPRLFINGVPDRDHPGAATYSQDINLRKVFITTNLNLPEPYSVPKKKVTALSIDTRMVDLNQYSDTGSASDRVDAKAQTK